MDLPAVPSHKYMESYALRNVDHQYAKEDRDYCHAVQFAKIVSYTPIVQAAVSFLHINYKQNTTIEKVAAYIPCHPNYLCQCFKKETGMTIIQMLTEIRFDYALTLLKNPSYPITQIASEVGFESYSHFSTIFKKKYGCSCSQWRKKCLKSNIEQ